MRNKFGGSCYKCGLPVTPGIGHFERHAGRWRVRHGLHSGQGRVTCDEARDENAKNPPIAPQDKVDTTYGGP